MSGHENTSYVAHDGVVVMPGARLIDRSGVKRLPVGDDGFARAVSRAVLVDKTMLIADVIDSPYTVTLFCRPRRFGKTLNMTMLKAFLEAPIPGDGIDPLELFRGTAIWDAQDGRYRAHMGAYPVVHVSFRAAKGRDWPATYAAMRSVIAHEFERHAYLSTSDALTPSQLSLFNRIVSDRATDAEYAGSLLSLCRMLKAHHGAGVVVLIDEYDAPVMAGYSASAGGYYHEVVDFLKGWLVGALKNGGEVLTFGVLTGVQRIAKESVFSDLNNLTVSTPLSSISDERYGFTEAEVEALAAYFGHQGCMDEMREWYDGYRFGTTDVYNPWSVINYLSRGCVPGVYWANTSSNDVVGELVRSSDPDTLSQVYGLLEPGGVVAASLDPGIVFPDVGVRPGAAWSMLYLAGYLTTDLTDEPENAVARRPLRVPNREIAQVFRSEIVDRFAKEAGGEARLGALHAALCTGDAGRFAEELTRIARDSASSFDLVSENAAHLLLLGLCFGVPGYADPLSNREAGYGRYDIRLQPIDVRRGSLAAFGALGRRPVVTIEVKFLSMHAASSSEEQVVCKLKALAQDALNQIAQREYDNGSDIGSPDGRLRWGVAFCSKRVAAVCEWLDSV